MTWRRSRLDALGDVPSAVVRRDDAAHPRHAVAARAGWISCVVPRSMALVLLTDEYAMYAVLAQPKSLPGDRIMAWLGQWIWVPATLLATFVLLRFPDGRLASRRWQPVAWLAGLVDLDALGENLRAVFAETMQPAHVKTRENGP